jgi:hypothetical protein
MRKYVLGWFNKHIDRIFTVKPKTKHYREIKWISRVAITILIVVGWIFLRRNHITTI